MLVPDVLHLGSFLFLRGLVQCGSPLTLYGIACLEVTISVLDLSTSGSAMSLRILCHMGLVMLAYGLAWLDTSMVALDSISFESLLLLQGFS